MDNNDYQQYKIAKTISEQIEYLNKNNRVQLNCMDKDTAKEKLLEYNYINIITPFKYQFAKLNENKKVEKVNGNHVYEKDVDFNEYYSLFKDERKRYPTIISNILDFESSVFFFRITIY